MKPYRPSNQVSTAGYQWLILSAAIGGAAIGGLTYLISLAVYLIILFPLAMGGIGGAIMSNAVRRGKVRHPAIAGLFGILAGGILYGSMHGSGYFHFRLEASRAIRQEAGKIDPTEVDRWIDAYLKQQTGTQGFWGYVKYSAKQGVSIGRVGSEKNNLGETGTWIYWFLEFVVIDAIIAAMAFASARVPFCESCEQWYGNQERIGSIPPQTAENFLHLLQEDQFSRAGALVDPLSGVYAPSLEVHLQHCPTCSFSDRVLRVSAASLDNKGNISLQEVAQGLISSSQYAKFQEAMTEVLTQTQDSNQNVSQEQMRLAQQERSSVTGNDRFEPHALDASQIAALVQQLSRYRQIKTAYLVRKTLQYFPERPLYVLGILRRSSLFESETARGELLQKLIKELVCPDQTHIVFLNQDKTLLQTLKQVTGATLYSK
ncbi:hypothetical protein BST81_13945 [Leptolyngbya sp. 'hensonii']|uniref:hypothetical protein n=1 Tax=Leptolyngbya sp. 'hensonii' TaxID=1922337 RepID=UPI00094F88FE|nr:hypothetical protein [Leptolyngbya sp. 'hensonii']OLP18119.1 hypothetical protein BST81_13945 [Leptolyngbya sp. 'hensonii']